MNYITELNAFYDWLEINELSASAINLWYALMHINNKAGWAETFTVAESVLSIKTKLSGRTVREARNELKQKGRIDFKSRVGGKAPIYTIISLARTTEIKSEEKSSTETNSAVSARGNAEGSAGDYAEGSAGDYARGGATLNKQNKTKQNWYSPKVTSINKFLNFPQTKYDFEEIERQDMQRTVEKLKKEGFM